MESTSEQRTDQSVSRELSRRAFARLQATLLVSARNLSVEVEGTVVVLRGRLNSFYQKQIAQEVVKRIDGVQSIRNQIEVA